MKYRLRQLKKATRDVKLEVSERDCLRKEMVSFMAERPVIVPTPEVGFSAISVVWQRRLAIGAAIFAAVILSGGSVVLAAEQTIPGDILYPVKVRISEPLQGVLKRSVEEKAAWEIERTNRRLKEAAQLAATDKLSPDISAMVTEEVSVQTQRTQASLEKLSEKTEKRAAFEATLEATLEVHTEQLRKATTNDAHTTSTREKAQHLHDAVEKTLEKVKRERGQESRKDKDEMKDRKETEKLEKREVQQSENNGKQKEVEKERFSGRGNDGNEDAAVKILPRARVEL